MRWPRFDSALVAPAVLAALTTWVTLMSWAGFVEAPSEYLVPTLGGVLLVAATGFGLRNARLPAVLVLLGQLVVVTLWLTHRWAADSALGGWIPTTSSVADVGALLRQGVAAAQDYQAPVPESAPEIHALLVLAGVLVAVLVDFLACGLRRVPVAGLPLLAVYTAPVSILDDGVPWWVFAAGAIGFLSLIVSDEGRRLQHWGRQVPRSSVVDTGEGPVAGTSIRTTARRIGLTSTALAVVAPLFIPTLGSGIFGGGGPGGDGGGDEVTISNPMVGLRRDLVRGRDVDLLTVRTDDADPAYLRIAVLDVWDGEAWRPSEREIPEDQRVDGLLPRPPGLESGVPREQVEYEIAIDEGYESKWLPAPYPVTTVDVAGDWRYDSDTFDIVSAVKDQETSGLDYSLTALEVTPTADDLANAGATPQEIFSRYTELPDGLPDTVSDLAREVTAGARTRYERAARLQRWFREDGGFEYSLAPAPGTGASDLEQFLSPDDRKGYCEQFSASMALMGRTLGIPSRVAVGFLRPDEVAEGEFVFSAWDLHAWPEMYFDGVGWVRFEPTPADRAEQVPGYSTGRLNQPEPTELPTASRPTTDPDEVPRQQREEDAAAAAAGDGGSGVGPALRTLLVLAATALVLALPWLARTLVRRRRWAVASTPAEVAEAGWRELRDVALDLRLPWRDGETLRTRARGLAALFGRPGDEQREGYVRGGRGPEAAPGAALALERVVRDVERARYSRGAAQEHGRGVEAVRADVVECADALRAGATKQRRRWATVLPLSLVRNGAWRSVLQRPAPVAAPAGSGVDRAV